MQGDLWTLRDGQRGIEIAATSEVLTLAVIREHWPYPAPPISVPREWCAPAPMRYLHGATPRQEPVAAAGEAR